MRASPKASLTLIQGNKCFVLKRKSKILGFLPHNHLPEGNFMREWRINCHNGGGGLKKVHAMAKWIRKPPVQFDNLIVGGLAGSLPGG